MGTTRNFAKYLNRMIRLNTAIDSAVTVGNTTTETTLLQTRKLRPVDLFAGLNIEFDIVGELTSTDAGTGNDVYLALVYGSTTLLEAQANNLIANASAVGWKFSGCGRFQTVGTSGIFTGFCELQVFESTIKRSTGKTAIAGVSVDLSASNLNTFALTADWQTANASNSLTAYAGHISVKEAE